MLAVQYLTTKKVRLRDKLCSVFLLLFFVVSFIIRQLDYIWHGFHFTNMIPYRFSFLFSFVLLVMAYQAFLMRKKCKLWQVVLSGAAALAVFACSNSRTDWVYLAYNLAFLLLYLTVMLYPVTMTAPAQDAEETEKQKFYLQRKKRRKTATSMMAGVMALELVLNLVNFGINFPGTGVSNYPKGTEHTASMIRYMQEREEGTLFYRAETTHSQTLNDGALNGYNGISTFTSSANVKVTEFMKALGYGAKNTYNRYCFEESSPVANLFLNLKYMLERDGNVEENNYFDEVHHYGEVYLLENNAYLPLGFLTELQLAGLHFEDSDDGFEFQNDLLKAASGITGDVWHQLTGHSLSITGNNVTITKQTKSGYCTYETESGGSIVYAYTADRDGLVCIDLTLASKNGYTVSKNGTELYSETYSLPQMISVCQVVPGDVIEIKLTCKSSEESNMTVAVAILDEALFREAYNTLSASTLELTTFENTLVEGTITCDRDGLLYTSIPQDGNWCVTVDGEEAEVVLIGDAMVGVTLTKGTHQVTFTYRNAAFSLGWKISLGCALVFLTISCIVYKPKKKVGKYERPAK